LYEDFGFNVHHLYELHDMKVRHQVHDKALRFIRKENHVVNLDVMLSNLMRAFNGKWYVNKVFLTNFL